MYFEDRIRTYTGYQRNNPDHMFFRSLETEIQSLVKFSQFIVSVEMEREPATYVLAHYDLEDEASKVLEECMIEERRKDREEVDPEFYDWAGYSYDPDPVVEKIEDTSISL